MAFLVAHAQEEPQAQAQEEDELPNFFGGRGTDGKGMVPPPPPEAFTRRASEVQTKWFTQKFDHYNISSPTWQQRYLVNEAKYRPGGPIFVWIGGEGELSPTWLLYGNMFVNAKKHGALMFTPEHRFYGESRPTPDVSVANLRFLTSQQALADLDNFIRSMKVLYKIPNAKVIVFGCSYPGSLAVWYRLWYPKTTVGAIASGAPILAKENFFEYMEAIGGGFKYFHPQCYAAVQDAFAKIQNLVAWRNDAELDRWLTLCAPKRIDYNNPNELSSFFFDLVARFMSKAQYNGVGSSSDIGRFCQTMTDTKIADPLQRYSSWLKSNGGNCVSHYGRGPAVYKTDWNASSVVSGSRQWLWQTCNEFGYFMTTDSANQPFGRTVAISYLKQVCRESFGITNEEQKVYGTNQVYGGRSPKVTNVFFMNGGIDPWHRLSVYEKDLNPSSPVRLIEGTSHCYDIFEARQDDPPQVTKARQDAANAISYWLQYG